MRFDIFTLFPEVFEPYLNTSILHRARQRGLVEVHLHNIRDWTKDRHHITDDEPYGGGGGIVGAVTHRLHTETFSRAPSPRPEGVAGKDAAQQVRTLHGTPRDGASSSCTGD